MKRTIYAVTASTLALAGCASTDAPDYVARAPTEPPQASKTSSHEALDARIAYHAGLINCRNHWFTPSCSARASIIRRLSMAPSGD